MTADDELEPAIHAEVLALSASGDDLAEAGHAGLAVEAYEAALALLPAPRADWSAATWLLAAIGDAQFLAGEYEQARDALREAMRCPDALGNPFLHLRLGQCQRRLGDEQRAADELARAFMGGGPELFEDEDPADWAFIRARLRDAEPGADGPARHRLPDAP